MNNNNRNFYNPANQFNPMSTNQQRISQNNPGMNNFNQSYQPNNNMIPNIKYENKGGMIHNNMGEEILAENIKEYVIHLDSKDRDVTVFKDPFNYIVSFNKEGKSFYKQRKPDGTLITHEMTGAPAPHIGKEFENIKYIRLDRVMLPKYSIIKESGGGDYDSFDETDTTSIFHDRFVMLKLKEIDNDSTYATNNTIEQSFGLIFPGTAVGNNFFFGDPINAEKQFKQSSLGKISRLSVEFCDSEGTPLKITGLTNASATVADPLDSAQTDFRSPTHKLIQNHITLVIGVVEAEQNVTANYRN